MRKRSFLEEYLSYVGPLLVLIVFAVAFRLRSVELAVVNIVLGAYLLSREHHALAADQPELERERQELIGDKPSRRDKLAFFVWLVTHRRHHRPAAFRIAGIAGLFMGTLQVLNYW